MIDIYTDVAIIGGGPAGLAAAISAKKNHAKKVVVIDRNSWLGGILPQCIHDGFGVEETGNSLTGPEYAEMYISMAKEEDDLVFMIETMVLEFNSKRELLAVNKDGLHKIRAKSIVLAMGCREKTRWNAMIPGSRPSGIFTAGVAQSFINLYNIMIGKNVIVLGSGDVGLIMARRLKFEGANVLGVVEIFPYATGLPRNVVQCLDDYDIPLYLNHTVTFIRGKDRLESVKIAQVDENKKIISGTEREIKCDTLLLSLGLTPENELSTEAGVLMDSNTGGPIVDQFYETSLKGVFACGNCLHVYDTVDDLSIDAKIAGKAAADFSMGRKKDISTGIYVKTGKGVSKIVPQKISNTGKISFKLRSTKPKRNVFFKAKINEKVFFKKKLAFSNPANMIVVDINITKEILSSKRKIEVSIDD